MLSVFLGLTGNLIFSLSFLKGFSVAYLFSSLLFHYVIYELRKPEEYYFYYNIGLGRFVLWGSTLTIGIILNLIFIL